MRTASIVFLLSAILLVPSQALKCDELILAGSGKPFDLSSIALQDARASEASAGGRPALRIETGHREPWPGATLKAPGDRWDLSRFDHMAAEVRNAGSSRLRLNCRVDNPGADGVANCVTGSIDLEPGRAGTLRVDLRRKLPAALAGKLFGMRGYPEGWDPKAGIDPARINQLILFAAKPDRDHAFEVLAIRAEGSRGPVGPAADPASFFPFIDGFGQYIHRDWPGKVRSEEDLARKRDEEARDLAARPGPAGRDSFGGWKDGPELPATDRFRTEKHRGKWWLVDPEGRLFFSQGIDCVRMLDITPIEGREGWFRDFPGDRPEFREFLVPEAFALHGHYAGKRPRCFNFAAANLRRKYGAGWREATADLAHRRLRSWGLNTIGNWSEGAVLRSRRMPYVSTLGTARGPLIEGSEGYWGKFPDVFDPEWEKATRERLRKGAEGAAGDAWCIGFFVDNEMSWGDETSLAAGALRSPAGQAAKRAFVEALKAKYGEIADLDRAWGTAHGSWEALLEARAAPPGKARGDLAEFSAKLADRYFAVVREALRSAAPGTLYLGCRFAWANPVAIRAAARHCDVLSFNIYNRSIAGLKLPEGVDLPVIIGEFHFGALDRGPFHTGLVPVKDQEERARAYEEYVRQVLRHPSFVGCHWFQYQDEPTTGRVYDEENYQIGFVDAADTPYPEIIEAARRVGEEMYGYRLGE
jgi:hypothetical protein